MNHTQRILGIDPGTTIMGFAILDAKSNQPPLPIEIGQFKLDTKRQHFERLLDIHQYILNLIELHHPNELAIEAPFFGKNVQSMLKLGRAQGVIIAAALSRQLPVFEYAPREVKQAITGRGGASKEQVAIMLKHLVGDLPMGLTEDATDALGVAICHAYRSSGPVELTPKIKNKAIGGKKKGNAWANFLQQNPDRLT
ncbi:MAG: crossover junction endodeoxyribonuclease RuvC [Bacteroidetes bacterium]|nr:crossover junction endodeoxyribonuclease RuvC [Bacteroidota bacterium]MDA0930057.1 crossover junction endodeoxyribonuclease RuvC [Bacteroidota bacterium]